MYGKIFEFAKKHWRSILCLVALLVLCASLLHCSKAGAQLSVKKNRISISKVVNKSK